MIVSFISQKLNLTLGIYEVSEDNFGEQMQRSEPYMRCYTPEYNAI
jgi:hypothetical protein